MKTQDNSRSVSRLMKQIRDARYRAKNRQKLREKDAEYRFKRRADEDQFFHMMAAVGAIGIAKQKSGG